jgi:hypothetical protein
VDNFDDHLQNLVQNSDCDSVSYIHLPKQLEPEEGAAEVFKWFLATSKEKGTGDEPVVDSGYVLIACGSQITCSPDAACAHVACWCRAQLALPSTFSPEERKRWHQVARQAGLYSASSGLREDRRLLVHASAADCPEQWKKKDIKVQAMARESHELLCEAHGGHSTYSLSELEEMIVTGVDLPPAILTLKAIKCESATVRSLYCPITVTTIVWIFCLCVRDSARGRVQCCRNAAADLWDALDANDAATAVQFLQGTEYPRELACRRSADRSQYPIHAAVSGYMPEVALELAQPARYAGVFTQRDSSGYEPMLATAATRHAAAHQGCECAGRRRWA